MNEINNKLLRIIIYYNIYILLIIMNYFINISNI